MKEVLKTKYKSKENYYKKKVYNKNYKDKKKLGFLGLNGLIIAVDLIH